MLVFGKEFEYIAPRSLKELFSILSSQRDMAVFAGGTDLFIRIKKGLIQPHVLLDLKRVEGLWIFSFYEGTLVIGATNTLSEVLSSPVVRRYFPILYECSLNVANYAVRNKATLVGNICSGFPTADALFALLLYDAEVEICSKDEIKRVRLIEMMNSSGNLSLSSGEIITKVFLSHKGEYLWRYYRIPERFHVIRAGFGIAYMVSMKEKRIVLGDVRSGIALLSSEEELKRRAEQRYQNEVEKLLLVEKVVREMKL